MSDMHEDFVEHAPSASGSDRSFGIVMAVAALLLAIFSPFSGSTLFSAIVFGISMLLVVSALAAPALLAPFNRLWTNFGKVLHRVVSPLILGVIFYLVVTPTGFLMRLAGKDLLRRNFDRAAKTYWIKRDPAGPAAESLKNQF